MFHYRLRKRGSESSQKRLDIVLKNEAIITPFAKLVFEKVGTTTVSASYLPFRNLKTKNKPRSRYQKAERLRNNGLHCRFARKSEIKDPSPISCPGLSCPHSMKPVILVGQAMFLALFCKCSAYIIMSFDCQQDIGSSVVATG